MDGEYICTQPYAATYIYYINKNCNFTNTLHDFEELSSKLNAEKPFVIYKRYSQIPYGKLIEITVMRPEI